jgi:cytochrome c oxidase subunit 4
MADEEKREEDAPEEKAAESKDEGSKEASASEESSAEDQADSTAEDGAPDEGSKDSDEQAAASGDDDGHGDDGHGRGGHGDHAHGGHDEHIGHTAPVSLLVGVLVALGLLTVLTVAVTAVDLGGQGNFVVAMVIATVKAILVMGYFMHLFWDAKFNVVAFASSFLFVLLFLAMTVLDRIEYQDDMEQYEIDKKIQTM